MSKKGFTLVETLFSAAIIALVFISVLAMFVHTVELSKRTDYQYIAMNLAKSRLEKIRIDIDTFGFDYLPNLAETSGQTVGPGGDFER